MGFWVPIAIAWAIIAFNAWQLWDLQKQRHKLREERRQTDDYFTQAIQSVASGAMSVDGAITTWTPGAHQFGGFGGPTLLPSGQWRGPTASVSANVQIHSTAMRSEDLTAPDEEEDVILTGWKRYDVSNGFLVSPVSGYVWHSPRLTASCPQLYNLGIGPEACTAAVPKHLQDLSAAHNCGIFAMKDPEDLNDPACREAIAKVSLFGIVQEGQYGYAAEKCIIEEVYLIRDIGDDEALEALTYRYNVPVKEEAPWT